MAVQKYILPIIVIAQFCCTSLWFASNGVLAELVFSFRLPTNSLGAITSAIQLGFITGTLVFAALTISDRFSPSRVFLACAILGGIFNLGMILEGNHLWSILGLRFLTGFFLAGIYPVGMKIASDYFEKGLGTSLGYLVGALVLGTAFPHLTKSLSAQVSWQMVIAVTSGLALLGGLLLWFLVPNGPFRQKSSKLKISAFLEVFKKSDFREAAFGYFGHMWELYAFWAFIPVALIAFNVSNHSADLDVSLWSFLIIAIGSAGCVLAGYLSRAYGEKFVAKVALSLSGLCCLASPFTFYLSPNAFLTFFLFWGMVVIADSPLFSTLIAKRADGAIKGTALTIVNCIGFSITIVSIQLLTWLSEKIPTNYLFIFLALGPILGLLSLSYNKRVKT